MIRRTRIALSTYTFQKSCFFLDTLVTIIQVKVSLGHQVKKVKQKNFVI